MRKKLIQGVPSDNGSGSIGLLEVAIQLSKFSVQNAIRFVWVSAEEFGLLGSEFYVASLSNEEKNKIRYAISLLLKAKFIPRFTFVSDN